MSSRRPPGHNVAKAKRLRAWAGIRNHAAHGERGELSRGDVEDMIAGGSGLLGDYLG